MKGWHGAWKHLLPRYMHVLWWRKASQAARKISSHRGKSNKTLDKWLFYARNNKSKLTTESYSESVYGKMIQSRMKLRSLNLIYCISPKMDCRIWYIRIRNECKQRMLWIMFFFSSCLKKKVHSKRKRNQIKLLSKKMSLLDKYGLIYTKHMHNNTHACISSLKQWNEADGKAKKAFKTQ